MGRNKLKGGRKFGKRAAQRKQDAVPKLIKFYVDKIIRYEEKQKDLVRQRNSIVFISRAGSKYALDTTIPTIGQLKDPEARLIQPTPLESNTIPTVEQLRDPNKLIQTIRAKKNNYDDKPIPESDKKYTESELDRKLALIGKRKTVKLWLPSAKIKEQQEADKHIADNRNKLTQWQEDNNKRFKALPAYHKEIRSELRKITNSILELKTAIAGDNKLTIEQKQNFHDLLNGRRIPGAAIERLREGEQISTVIRATKKIGNLIESREQSTQLYDRRNWFATQIVKALSTPDKEIQHKDALRTFDSDRKHWLDTLGTDEDREVTEEDWKSNRKPAAYGNKSYPNNIERGEFPALGLIHNPLAPTAKSEKINKRLNLKFNTIDATTFNNIPEEVAGTATAKNYQTYRETNKKIEHAGKQVLNQKNFDERPVRSLDVVWDKNFARDSSGAESFQGTKCVYNARLQTYCPSEFLERKNKSEIKQSGSNSTPSRITKNRHNLINKKKLQSSANVKSTAASSHYNPQAVETSAAAASSRYNPQSAEESIRPIDNRIEDRTEEEDNLPTLDWANNLESIYGSFGIDLETIAAFDEILGDDFPEPTGFGFIQPSEADIISARSLVPGPLSPPTEAEFDRFLNTELTAEELERQEAIFKEIDLSIFDQLGPLGDLPPLEEEKLLLEDLAPLKVAKVIDRRQDEIADLEVLKQEIYIDNQEYNKDNRTQAWGSAKRKAETCVNLLLSDKIYRHGDFLLSEDLITDPVDLRNLDRQREENISNLCKNNIGNSSKHKLTEQDVEKIAKGKTAGTKLRIHDWITANPEIFEEQITLAECYPTGKQKYSFDNHHEDNQSTGTLEDNSDQAKSETRRIKRSSFNVSDTKRNTLHNLERPPSENATKQLSKEKAIRERSEYKDSERERSGSNENQHRSKRYMDGKQYDKKPQKEYRDNSRYRSKAVPRHRPSKRHREDSKSGKEQGEKASHDRNPQSCYQ